MSRENAEVVGRSLKEYCEPAPEDINDFAVEFWDPDGDYYPVRKFPEARPCHGRDEIGRFHAQFLSAWDGGSGSDLEHHGRCRGSCT